MATSGQTIVKVTDYNNLVFNWTQTSQSYANNSTTISWSLTLTSTSSGTITSTATKNWSVNINGNTYSGTNTVGIPMNSSKTLASGTTTIEHNADGSKTFSYSFTQQFGITFSLNLIGVISGSGVGTLNTIPRAASIISAPNFTDEENPTITYSNPAGNSVIALQACISIVGGGGGDDIPYRDIPATGNSYTFNLTDAERNTLRNAVTSGNSISVRFYVLTNIGGTLNSNYITRTFTINGANPVINSVGAQDISEQTLALTGNTEHWIKGFSNVSYNINATAQKGASISSISATCGSDTLSGSSGTFMGVKAGSISITVTDSRGNATRHEIVPARWIDYSGLTCTVTKAKMDIDNTMEFTATGVYFMGSFGTTSNSLELFYRYKQENADEFTEWISLPVVASNNSYSATQTITDLDYRETYILQVAAQDKLQTIASHQYGIHKALPVFDWGENDFNVNVNTYVPTLVLKGTNGIYNAYSDNTAKDIMRLGSNDFLYIGTGGKTDGVGGTYVGGESVTMAANGYAFITAPSGVYINNNPLMDFVVEQGASDYWYYRKWNSGICEMWGWCEPTYQAAHYLSTYQAFPVELVSWISAQGTINGYGGNLAAYLSTNVKIECMNYGCNVWVQNSNNSFQSGDKTSVSIHVIGRWKAEVSE